MRLTEDTMARHSTSSLLVSLPFASALASSCVDIPPLPDPIVGHQWCIDADPTTGRRQDNINLFEITHPDSGVWMRGCRCFCPAEHEIMVAGANGQLVADSADELFYQSQVSLLRADAQLACAERVIDIQDELGTPLSFDDPDTVSVALLSRGLAGPRPSRRDSVPSPASPSRTPRTIYPVTS